MTNTNPSEGPQKTTARKRRFLSAEKKFQIYLEAQSFDKSIPTKLGCCSGFAWIESIKALKMYS